MLIFSLMISMSALALEVTFGVSKETDNGGYDYATAIATVPIRTSNGNDSWNDSGAVTHTVIYVPSTPNMTGAVPEATVTPANTEGWNEPVTGAPDTPTTQMPIWTGNDEGGKDDGATAPNIPPFTLEGETRLYAGNTFGYSVYVNEPMLVKAGAISISFNSDVFSIEYMGWYSINDPIIASTNYEQQNGVFAYADATYISGEIFYFTLRVNNYASYGPQDISVDIILKDENQNDVEIEDPTLHAYVGCQDHYFNAVIDSSALANPATCHSYAEYYYTCGNCGMLDYSTFTDYDSGFADHSIRDVWHADEEMHWHGCDNCHDMDTDMDKHSFGKWLIVKEATKDEMGIRECSCTVCGYTKAENFKYVSNSGSDSDDTDTEVTETEAVTTTAADNNITVNIGGCGSSITLGTLAVLPVLAGAVLIKKKED